MAASVANSAYLAFGSNGSTTTEVDRSTYFSNISFPMNVAEVDITAFGNSGNSQYLPGLKDATMSADGFFDATINTHIMGIRNGGDVVEWEYGPEGNGSGKVKFSGSFFVTSYEPSSPVGGANSFSVSFRLTTGVTVGTFT